MTRWINRGGYDLNDPTDSSSESDEEEAWQRMVVIADEKMHFTKRQSKKQHSLPKMAVSVGNKTKVYQNRKEICVSCQQEEFVYSADPCGHAIFCSNCILTGIKPAKYTYTIADGTIATHHSYFVPVKCPLCGAIIGSLYKEAN
nr:PREDICTED: uncharacterized protein LOC109036186 [Bemisia tabaci]